MRVRIGGTVRKLFSAAVDSLQLRAEGPAAIGQILDPNRPVSTAAFDNAY
jgi:hypothetical protein